MDWARVVDLILVALGSGAAVALINAIANRRKTRAEASSADAQAALALAEAAKLAAETATSQVDTLQRSLDRALADLSDARATIAELELQQKRNVAAINNLQLERNDWRNQWLEAQRRIDYLTAQRIKLNEGIGKLINQLESELNVKPVWRPEGTKPLSQ
jgi:type IV secretory pathway VirJ component